jgi:hypothetical protein
LFKLCRGVLLLTSLVGACRWSKPVNQAGTLQIRWSGREPGRMAGSATAGWCAPRHMLEVRGILGDTGVAVVLYPAETLTAGIYRVVEPARAESLAPAAALALRWLTPKTVQGFRGESGTVKLERSSSGRVSGEVKARAKSVVDTQRVTVTGSFHDLMLRLEPSGCATATPERKAADAEETSVH